MEAKVSDIYLHLSATTCNIFLDVADMIMKDGQVVGLFLVDIGFFPINFSFTLFPEIFGNGLIIREFTFQGFTKVAWLKTHKEDSKVFVIFPQIILFLKGKEFRVQNSFQTVTVSYKDPVI